MFPVKLQVRILHHPIQQDHCWFGKRNCFNRTTVGLEKEIVSTLVWEIESATKVRYKCMIVHGEAWTEQSGGV